MRAIRYTFREDWDDPFAMDEDDLQAVMDAAIARVERRKEES